MARNGETAFVTKVAIVTGGARGLGLLTARKLAARRYHVIMTARDMNAGRSAVDEIRNAVKDARVDCLQLDVSSLRSVRLFVEEFGRLGLPLHLLVNNAGVMSGSSRPQLSADGIEMTLATNAVGPFLLTNLLLPYLKQTAPSRIVMVSSSMHIPGVGRGPGPTFDWDDLNGQKSFHPVTAYRNSKLALMWFTYELSRRLEGTGVCVNAVCPGFVPETLVRHQPTLLKRLLFRYILPRMSFARSPERGADSIIYAAASLALEGVSGKFIMDCSQRPSSDDSYDLAKAKRWWETASSLCALGDPVAL